MIDPFEEKLILSLRRAQKAIERYGEAVKGLTPEEIRALPELREAKLAKDLAMIDLKIFIDRMTEEGEEEE